MTESTFCDIIGAYGILFHKILRAFALCALKSTAPIDGVAKMLLQASIFVPGKIYTNTSPINRIKYILSEIYTYILSLFLLKVATLSKSFSVGKQTFLEEVW